VYRNGDSHVEGVRLHEVLIVTGIGFWMLATQ